MKKYAYLLSLAILCAMACKKEDVRKPDTTYNPDLSLAKFSNPTDFTNIYFPMEAGKKYILESQTNEGLKRIELQRLSEIKTILGINCVVVNDKVWLGNVIIEDTYDWYAQDNDGNVWYMGEDVDNFNLDGTLKNHDGSWEAGVDDAKPGIIMKANPQVGDTYRLEYYFNVSEDQAEITAVGQTVTTPLGTFENCIKVHETTELDPDLNEDKYFAPGIGGVKVVNITDNEEELLVDIEE